MVLFLSSVTVNSAVPPSSTVALPMDTSGGGSSSSIVPSAELSSSVALLGLRSLTVNSSLPS